jgi:hypothetical protein
MLGESLINKTAELLKKYGEVDLQFVPNKPGLPPGEGIPDLIFIPKFGPNQGVLHVVEYKQCDTKILPDVFLSNANLYNRKLQEAYPGVKFALSSNADVVTDEENKANLKVISDVRTADELAQWIADWSQIETK